MIMLYFPSEPYFGLPALITATIAYTKNVPCLSQSCMNICMTRACICVCVCKFHASFREFKRVQMNRQEGQMSIDTRETTKKEQRQTDKREKGETTGDSSSYLRHILSISSSYYVIRFSKRTSAKKKKNYLAQGRHLSLNS